MREKKKMGGVYIKGRVDYYKFDIPCLTLNETYVSIRKMAVSGQK